MIGSIKADYKPTLALLKNSDLLIVFRNHECCENSSVPLRLYAVTLRSNNRGLTWQRNESLKHVVGEEFALHSLSDGTVLLQQSFGKQEMLFFALLLRLGTPTEPLLSLESHKSRVEADTILASALLLLA